MKDLKSMVTSAIHSRMAKTLKKSLKQSDIEISQSQASEAMANVLGFSNYHAANEFYSRSGNMEKSTSDDNAYLVSYSCRTKGMYDEIGEVIKSNVLFKGFTEKHFHFFELSKRIDLFYFNLSLDARNKFEDFLSQTAHFLDEEDRDEHLNLMPYEVFNHDEYELLFRKIFNEDEKYIKAFDAIFEEYLHEIENASDLEPFVIYSEENKTLKEYTQFKIVPLSESEVAFLEKNALIDLTIEK